MLSDLIGKAIKLRQTIAFVEGLAIVPILVGVIIGNQGNPYRNALGRDQGRKALEIIKHSAVILPRIGAVDGRVTVLAVDKEVIDTEGRRLHRLPRHV